MPSVIIMGGEVIPSTKTAIHPRREILQIYRENGLLSPKEVWKLLPILSPGLINDVIIDLVSEERLRPIMEVQRMNWDIFLKTKYYLARI